MKRFLLALVVAPCIFSASYGQDAPAASLKKQPTLAINFIMNDFTTAQRIKKNSLGGVLQGKDWAQFNEMAYGLSLQYLQGLTNHVDFSGTVAGSFLKYPFSNKPTPANDALLIEADATLNLKLLTDKYILVPYANVGLGASLYKMSTFAAHIPVGLGFQVNLGNSDAFFFTQGNYKVAVSGPGANHFTYSLGFAAPLKK
jgi:OmpA-OmpF porin, OOP family